MVFDFTNSEYLSVSMNSYISEVLKECNIEGTAPSPCNNNIFHIDEKSKLLDRSQKEYFHSIVAKLLYLSKRVRPDILLSICFLATRVQEPTEQDMNKLNRLMMYLNGTKELGLKISADNIINISAYIDASYGTHSDYKSHSGCTISMGRGVIYAKSNEQKLNSKSSTEAEMIAVSDNLNHILWLRNFLESQGYKLPPCKVFQDNMSAISLFKTGKSSSNLRTRHIAIRFYFAKDRMDNKEITIEFMNTHGMIADILTKPMQGAKFLNLRKQLMGH